MGVSKSVQVIEKDRKQRGGGGYWVNRKAICLLNGYTFIRLFSKAVVGISVGLWGSFFEISKFYATFSSSLQAVFGLPDLTSSSALQY